MGEVFFAGEEAKEGSALAGEVIANGAVEHRVAGFEGVEDGSDGGFAGDVELDLPLDAGEGAEVGWKADADHGRVCTSTERTAGRSRTMGAQESPESEEA